MLVVRKEEAKPVEIWTNVGISRAKGGGEFKNESPLTSTIHHGAQRRTSNLGIPDQVSSKQHRPRRFSLRKSEL